MRCPDDMAHMRMLDRFGNPSNGSIPSLEDLPNIKFLSSDDIKNDVSWATAPVIVITNKEMHSYNTATQNTKANSKYCESERRNTLRLEVID